MTNEEMEKAMKFIVEQQAQFSVDIQKIQEAQTGTNQLLNRLAAATVQGFENVEARSSEMSENVDRKIAALVDSQLRTEESLKRTNDDLRNLIAVVDRYFSEGRNGK